MAYRDVSDLAAVPAAMEEFDHLGRDAFLEKYGFGKAPSYFLIYDNHRYDSKAIVVAAHGFQHGRPLGPRDSSGGAATVAPLLAGLGFEVVAGTTLRA